MYFYVLGTPSKKKLKSFHSTTLQTVSATDTNLHVSKLLFVLGFLYAFKTFSLLFLNQNSLLFKHHGTGLNSQSSVRTGHCSSIVLGIDPPTLNAILITGWKAEWFPR